MSGFDDDPLIGEFDDDPFAPIESGPAEPAPIESGPVESGPMGPVLSEPASRNDDPLGRPGCMMAALSGAVGAVVGALVAGVILFVALSGDDTATIGQSSPSGASDVSAPIGSAASESPSLTDGSTSPSSADPVSADGTAADDATVADAAASASGADGASSTAESAELSDTSDGARPELAQERPVDEAVGAAPQTSAELGSNESAAEFLDDLLSGDAGTPGAPLGSRFNHINVKAVLEAVQDAVVIVKVTMQDGDEGGGSGFIVTPEGRIVTNAHVVEDAEDIEVRFSGGSQMSAEIVAIDPTRDLAVLQVAGDDLPTVRLGSSDGVEVGDEVIAVGNAIGIIGEPTVTSGIVSGLDRTIELEDDTRLVRLIQTDAAINPGNSGGPLVNAAGEVIGVNTAIAGGFVEGIGFAISIEHARPIIDGLIEGVVRGRAYLGVRIVSVDDWIGDDAPTPDEDPTDGLGDSGPETVEPGPDPSEEFSDIELPDGITTGALVLFVEAGQAADDAGIGPGEVIVEFNGSEIRTSTELVVEILARVPGDNVELTVVDSDGNRRIIDLELGALEPQDSE